MLCFCAISKTMFSSSSSSILFLSVSRSCARHTWRKTHIQLICRILGWAATSTVYAEGRRISLNTGFIMKYTFSISCLLWATIFATESKAQLAQLRISSGHDTLGERWWQWEFTQWWQGHYKTGLVWQTGFKMFPELSSSNTCSIMLWHTGNSADRTLNSAELQLTTPNLDTVIWIRK